MSALYRTRPVSAVVQPDFLNLAVVGESRHPPEELLAVAKALEWRAGRRSGPRWGPRPLDVDLLVWGDRVVRRPELTLPHPRLARRRFVLEPLATLAPELRVPPGGRTVADLLARLPAGERVTRVGWTGPPPAAW